MSCHATIQKTLRKVDVTVALAGNPNVGKSTLFNRLTGLQADTANYPGKTVDLNLGVTKYNEKTIGLIDLPGTYSVDPTSDDQWVARRALLEERPDLVIVVVDASNLQRNLYQTLQLIELEMPIVIALNLIDHAEKIGIRTDSDKLSKMLGVQVIRMVASKGEGIQELLEYLTNRTRITHTKIKLAFETDIEQATNRLEETFKPGLEAFGLGGHALALRLLENDPEFTELVASQDPPSVEKAHQLGKQIQAKYSEPPELAIARQRHELARQITETTQVQTTGLPHRSEKFMHYAVSPYTGVPLAFGVIAGIFVFMLTVGGFLGNVTSLLWAGYASPSITFLITSVVRNRLLSQVLLWGFDAGMLGAVSVGIPYVLTFYLVLSLLEDSGYLGCLAYLADTVMHKIGLHGRAIIPIIMGFGCNVPAIMGTRVLETRRERILASTLITLTPCSARTAVIIAAVGVLRGMAVRCSDLRD